MRGRGGKQSDPAEPWFPHLEGTPKHLRPAQIRYSINRAVLGRRGRSSLQGYSVVKSCRVLPENQPCEKEGRSKPGKCGIHV